jgi:hypothetical protein
MPSELDLDDPEGGETASQEPPSFLAPASLSMHITAVAPSGMGSPLGKQNLSRRHPAGNTGTSGDMLAIGRLSEAAALRGTERDNAMQDVLGQLKFETAEWARYIHFNEGRRYSRNLVAYDKEFSAVLLCWKAGQATPAHDHGGVGTQAWIKVMQGELELVRQAPCTGAAGAAGPDAGDRLTTCTAHYASPRGAGYEH